MKQLSGVDASFLYMETPTSFGHVSGLAVFARPDDPAWSPYEAMHAKLTRRLPDLEPLRRRLVEVPFQLDHPYWIEDPAFDMEFHLRDAAIPAPGSDTKLAELVARIIARPLDRGHPLWECYVIEGLVGDRFAILTKLHHATIDGAAGAELIKVFYDVERGVVDQPERPELPPPEQVPSPAHVLARVMTDAASKPAKYLQLQLRGLQAMGELTRNRGVSAFAELARSAPNPLSTSRGGESATDADTPAPPPSGAAPPTPFNGSITAQRRVAFRSVPLGDVKAIKSATDTTVNDVVMAACAGALRTYLIEHGALPDAPLVAMVPVSIRTGTEADPWTNRVSSMFPPLPTDLDDPIARLQAVSQTMNDAKERFALVPADVLVEYADFAPPAMAIRAAQMTTQLRVADQMNPPFNVVISNVPGPRQTLWLDQAEMLHYYPVSTISETQGLNITVQSYRDTMDIGLVGARERVPDIDHLIDLIVDEFAILSKAAGVSAVS